MYRVILLVCMVAISTTHCAITWQGNWALGCDFIGNDLTNERTKGEDCGTRCSLVSGCTHFTWTDYNGKWYSMGENIEKKLIRISFAL